MAPSRLRALPHRLLAGLALLLLVPPADGVVLVDDFTEPEQDWYAFTYDEGESFNPASDGCQQTQEIFTKGGGSMSIVHQTDQAGCRWHARLLGGPYKVASIEIKMAGTGTTTSRFKGMEARSESDLVLARANLDQSRLCLTTSIVTSCPTSSTLRSAGSSYDFHLRFEFDWAADVVTLRELNTGTSRSITIPGDPQGVLDFNFFENSARTSHRTTTWDDFVVDTAVPSAPFGLDVAEGPEPTDLTLSWSAPTDPGASPILGYRIYEGTSASGLAHLDDTGTATAYDHLGVGFSQTRYYQVSAFNAYGEGPRSPVVSGTTPDPVPPQPPRNPSTVAGPEPGQVTVTWQAPERGSAPRVTHYTVERSASPTGPFAQVGGPVLAPALLGTDLSAPAGVASHYRVFAWNSEGSSAPSPVVAGRPEAAPGAPRSLTATADASGDALSWRAPLGDGGLPVLEYKVHQSSDGGQTFLPKGSTPALGLTVTPSCPTCVYRVTARNAVDEGLPSNLASPAFEAWPQESVRGNTPGAGVGLADVHRCEADGGSINLATGQFVSSVCLARLASPLGLDIEVVATHRSHGTTSSVAGHGWDLSTLRRLDADGQDALLLDGQGREDRFTWDAIGGDYATPPGFYMDLDRTPSGGHELRHPGGLVEAFAADGRRTEVRDALGHALLFRYDLQGRPLEVREPSGRSVYFQYGARGLAAVNDAAGRTTTLDIDAAGDLAAIAAEAARPDREHRFTYTARHDLETATDPDGREYLANTYDDAGRVERQDDGVGHIAIAYDAAARATTVTSPQGKVTWEFDGQAVATAKTEWTDQDVRGNEPPSYVTRFTSNAHGELAVVEWPDGRRSEWTYDVSDPDPRARGNVESYREVPADGTAAREWTSTFEAAYQLPRSVTAPLGHADGYVPPNGGANTPQRHTTTFWYGHDEAGQGDLNGDGLVGGPAARVVRIEHPEANPDGAAHPLMGSGNQERVQLVGYNARGQVTRLTQPDGAVRLYEYYEPGEATVARPLFQVKSVQWLLQGGAALASSSTSGEGDLAGGLLPVPAPPSPGLPPPMPALGATLESLVEAIGPVAPAALSSFAPEDGPIESFEYDEAGHVVLAVDPNGQASMWAYDELGRVVQSRSPGEGSGVDYTYDGRGNLVEVARLNARQADDGTYVVDATRPALVDRFAYDAAGHLVERRLDVTSPGGAPAEAVEQFAYDAAGRMVLHRRHDAVAGMDPDAVTTYLYNERGQLVAATEGGYTDEFARHAGDGLDLEGVSRTTTLYLHADVEQVASCPDNADLALHESCRQAPAGDCPGGVNGTVVNGRATCRTPLRFPVAVDGLQHVGNLPAARQGSSAVWDVARGLVYVLGGSSSGAATDEIVSYDPQTQEAQVVAHLPAASWFGAAAFDGQHVYYFGGCRTGCTSRIGDIVRFDPATNAVAVVGSLPAPLAGHAAAWDGSKVYLFGGCGDPCSVTRDILSFDPATGQVTLLPGKLPKANLRMPAVWTGEQVLLFGGTGSDGHFIAAFDPDTGTAVHLATPLPMATSESAAAWDGRFAYVFGGLLASGNVRTPAILRYDPAEDELVTMSQGLAEATSRLSAVWTTDSALVIGGSGSASGVLRRIDQYKPVAEAPTEPRQLVALPGPDPGQTTLRWQAPDSTGSTSLVAYHLHRASQAGGPYEEVAEVDAAQRHAVVAAGAIGQTDHFVVTAENGDLQGDASAEASILNTPTLPVEAPIGLCPGPGSGVVIGGNEACPEVGACPAGSIGGVVPVLETTSVVPVCVSVVGCPAGTVGVIAAEQAVCQPVAPVCTPLQPCGPADPLCYLPTCLHIIHGVLATHLGADGIGAQAEVPGVAGPIVVYLPLGGLPYNVGLPVIDLDPEPPEEPEEPVPDPSWLWTYTMDGDVRAGNASKAIPSVSQAPAIAYWQYEPDGGYDLAGNAQLVFWAVRDPASETQPSSRWNARLYADDELVASTDPHEGVAFTGLPGEAPQEYRIHFGELALNGSRLRLELDLDATPAGRLMLFDHAETPSRLEIGRPVTTTTDYDAGGRPTVVTDAVGAQTVHAYDGHGQEISVTGPDGARHDSARDPAGRAVESATYGDAGAAEPIELERSRSFHDEAGRVYRVDRAFFDPATGDPLPDGPLFPGDGWVTTLYDYDAAGRVVATIDDNGAVTRFEYDPLGRLVATTDAVGNRVESTYDAKGNLVNRTEIDLDAVGAPMAPRTTLFAHDELDRLVEAVDPLARVHRFGYDSRGNQAWSLDAKGNRVDFAYDAQDRLVATVRELRAGGVGGGALLGFVNTTQDWDADGRLVRQTDDSGSSTAYEYDSFGRLARTLFADATNETHEYDARGLLVATTKPDGAIIHQEYDEAGRLVARTAGGAWPVLQAFAYDGAGRMTRATEDDSTVAFGYDSLGNQVLEAQGAFAVSRTFDGVGNALALAYPNGRSVTREPDALGRMTQLRDASGLLASFTYEGGRLASRTAGNGVTSTYTYDAAQQVTEIDHDLPGLARPFRFEYTYDGNGNRVEELFHHAPEWSKAAAYDSLDRLVAFERSNVGSLPSVPNPLQGILPTSSAWTLDGANEWDMLDVLQDGVWANQTRSHDAMHALETITSSATTTFSSDLNGNRLTDGRFNYTWDGLNRLRQVNDATTGDLVATYHYDPLGRRVQKVLADSETTVFLYDGMDVIEERGESGVVMRQFVHGDAVDQPITMDAAGQRLYYFQDSLGSVTGLMDEEGALAEGYLYDAYGNTVVLQPGASGEVTWTSDDVVATSSVLGNPYAFTGQRLDMETGLMYYRARYYDSGVGQFLSRDPIGVWGDPANFGSGYAYVGLNPGLATDPLGLWRFSISVSVWFVDVGLTVADDGISLQGGFGLGTCFPLPACGSLSIGVAGPNPSVGCQLETAWYPLVGSELGTSGTRNSTTVDVGIGWGASVGTECSTAGWCPWCNVRPMVSRLMDGDLTRNGRRQHVV